jgi:NAD-dependent dihydropyrimidine dehydrogenase PreA subunit/flavodoxin
VEIDYFVFSGTGNTLLIAREVAAGLEEKGCRVTLRKMEDGAPSSIAADHVVGLAFPMAFFSSYPLVLDFINRLPKGNGQKLFITVSMAGSGLGAEAKFRSLISAKGYQPAAFAYFLMPSNYNNKVLPVKKNEALVAAAKENARKFAADFADGRAAWGFGIPPLSSFWHWFVTSGKAMRLFYKMFPLEIDNEKCVKCMRCMENCPAGAIDQNIESLFINRTKCQNCQRCVGFCPAGAIVVPGKPAAQYRAMEFEDFRGK